jgi:DNA-binding NarL/FixJ family response regulator
LIGGFDSGNGPRDPPSASQLIAASIVALELQPLRAEGLRQVLVGCEDLRLAASEISPDLALKRAAETHPRIVLVDGDLGAREVTGFLAALRSVSPGSQPVLWIPAGGGHEFKTLSDSGLPILARTSTVRTILEVLRRAAHIYDVDENSQNPAYVRAHFTAKERDILDLLCRGLTNAEIGREMGISPSTVKVHLAHMYDKSGFHTRGSLAAHAKSPAVPTHPL